MRLRRATAALAFALLAGSIPAVAAQAVPQAATITPPPVVKPVATIRGVVTDSATGSPVAGACIDAYALNIWAPRAQVCTDADGKYELAAWPSSVSTWLRVTAAGYPARWWPNAVTIPIAFSVSPDTVKQADFALNVATADLSGLVRQPNGAPAPQATVTLTPPGSTARVAFLVTRPDGRFTAPPLPPGDYQVQFTWENYQTRTYGVVTLGAGTHTDLTLDVPAQDPTPTPRARGTVSGRVTTDSGAPVSGATVQIKLTSTSIYGEATTDANGAYAIPNALVNSGYYLEVNAPGQPPVWAPNSPLPRTILISAATPMNVVIAQHTGTLSGRVVDFDGGTPPGQPRLLIYAGTTTQGSVFAIAYARPDGTFEVPRMPLDSYRIAVSTAGRPQQFHPAVRNWADSTTFTVQDGQTTDVTFNLVPPTYLQATILDAQTGAPIPGACVGGPCAGADGVAFYGPLWTIDPTITISVYATAGHTYYSQYRTFTLNRGEVTAAEFRLEPGAALAIPVSNAAQAGQVCLYLLEIGIAPGREHSCSTSADGASVVFGPVQPGLRQVFIQTGVGTGAQWLGANGGTGRREEAVILDLRLREVTQAPATTLYPAGIIEGYIRSASDGSPIPYACASVTNDMVGACAGSDGHYLIAGLGPYSWPVVFSSGFHAVQWSGNAPNGRVATGVDVIGNLATQVDASLQPQGFLAGLDGIGVEPSTVVEAFDAWTGHRISQANIGDHQSLGGLNSGRVLLRYIGSEGPCWLRQKTSDRFESPYFSTRQGQILTVDASKLTCRPGEPALLREPGRRGEPPTPGTAVPRRTVPDTAVTTKARLPFGRWVQEQLAALG